MILGGDTVRRTVRTGARVRRSAHRRGGHWSGRTVVCHVIALGRSFRIVELDLWDRDAVDLVAPAILAVDRDGTGHVSFLAVEEALDCRFRTDPTEGPSVSSAGKAATTVTPCRAAVGSVSTPTARSPVTSTSTSATTPASEPAPTAESERTCLGRYRAVDSSA